MMTHIKSERLLTYKGNLTFETIDEILSQYKEVIRPLKVDLVVQKRLYSILVECLENTYRHTSKVPAKLSHEMVELALSYDDTFFTLSIGNYVEQSKLNDLTAKIELVNALDQTGLNKLYKASISKARISNKGGAGLGIIEIARNSRHKLNYNIAKSENNYKFFSFEIKLLKHLIKNN